MEPNVEEKGISPLTPTTHLISSSYLPTSSYIRELLNIPQLKLLFGHTLRRGIQVLVGLSGFKEAKQYISMLST